MPREFKPNSAVATWLKRRKIVMVTEFMMDWIVFERIEGLID